MVRLPAVSFGPSFYTDKFHTPKAKAPTKGSASKRATRKPAKKAPKKAAQTGGPARKRHQLITTPKGRFKFPFLTSPDTKFDKDGKFRVDLILDEDAAPALIKLLGKLHKEAIANGVAEREAKIAKCETAAARKKVVPLIEQDFFTNEESDGEPTGNVIFKFGTKAKLTVTDKNGEEKQVQRVIPLYDAKGHRITGTDVQVWAGTVGKISFFALPYYIPATGFCGLSFRLAAAQVIELVNSGGGNRSASEFGFGQEDGYEFEEPKDTAAPKETKEDSATDLDEEIPF